MKPVTFLLPALLVVGACPGPRSLDGLACDPNGLCLAGFTCVESTCVRDDELDAVCGDGRSEGLEDCDGADTRGATCENIGQRLGTLKCTPECRFDLSECSGPCGDGVKSPLEACDEGNADDAGLCNGTCDRVVPAVLEVEPNDDGATAVGEDDYSSATATGPFITTTLIAGSYANGDEDVFALEDPNGAGFDLFVWSGEGVGTCAGLSPAVVIRDAAGNVISDVTLNGIGPCPTGVFSLGGARVFLHIRDDDDTDAGSYLIGLRYR